jgi:hypothetical protein
MRRAALLGTLMIGLSATLSAEIFLSDYDAFKNLEGFKNYIDGVGVGFEWANANVQGQKIYCQPKQLSLNQENYLHMLDEAVKEWRRAPGTIPNPPVELLLLRKLQRVFPCEAPKE